MRFIFGAQVDGWSDGQLDGMVTNIEGIRQVEMLWYRLCDCDFLRSLCCTKLTPCAFVVSESSSFYCIKFHIFHLTV